MELQHREPNRFYKLAIWTRARGQYIRAHPFCEAPGCRSSARVVDHIIPITIGGETLDPENFAALCDRCHNRKRSLEYHYTDFFIDLRDLGDNRRTKSEMIALIFDKTGGG
jgi:5-methylcytosine-specific restriction endonuclease McrA